MLLVCPNDKLSKLSSLYDSVDKNVISVELLGYDTLFSECSNRLNEILNSENIVLIPIL